MHLEQKASGLWSDKSASRVLLWIVVNPTHNTWDAFDEEEIQIWIQIQICMNSNTNTIKRTYTNKIKYKWPSIQLHNIWTDAGDYDDIMIMVMIIAIRNHDDDIM